MRERGAAQRSSTVPWATTSPPWIPAPGPRSTTWSAVRMVSSSCSTTTTVFPRSRMAMSVSRRRRLSLLVKADGGLVQDVQDAGELAADLGGEADALALAARERGGGAGEREVARGPHCPGSRGGSGSPSGPCRAISRSRLREVQAVHGPRGPASRERS